MIQDVQEGQLVTSVGHVSERLSGTQIPAGTVGIVTHKGDEEVCVEFELDENLMTQPILFWPMYLRPA